MKSTGHATVLQKERETLGLTDKNPGTALSISGGGIRSATFALGAIQALAQRQKLLKNFDYLSTVSGGGYIGGWLTAWKKRENKSNPYKFDQDEYHEYAIEKIIEKLNPDAWDSSDDIEVSEKERGKGEPKEISHLRAYSNYLTPKLGATSFDFWAVIAAVIRNMLLNWTVLIPFLMVVLFIPRLYAASISFPDHYFFNVIFIDEFKDHNTEDYASWVLDSVSRNVVISYLLPALAILFFSLAQANMIRYLPSHRDPKDNYHGRDFFIGVLAPLVVSVWCLDAWNNLHWIGSLLESTPVPVYLTGVVLSYALAISFALYKGVKPERYFFFAITALILIPAFWAWLVYNQILWAPGRDTSIMDTWYWAQYTTYALPLVLLGISGGIMLLVGLTAESLDEVDREWLARTNGGLIFFAIAWFLLSFAVLIAPAILIWVITLFDDTAGLPLTTLVSSIGALLGWFVSRQGQDSEEKPRTKKTVIWSGTLLFIFLLIVSLSLLTNVLLQEFHQLIFSLDCEYSNSWCSNYIWSEHANIISRSNPFLLVVFVGAIAILSVITGRVVNTNIFSLQGMYRNRLVRAYLGASNDERNNDSFSGFDPDDDLPLRPPWPLDEPLRPLRPFRLLDEPLWPPAPEPKPYHVVNLAMNLVGGSNLEWQQRKAASFIASPLYCGCKDLEYRPTAEYGGPGGMTLGMAVATSGAAASPNMGYHSSPVITFIMTLFNARLGIWLGNPHNERTSKLSSPDSALVSLVGEAFGRTSGEGDYVYLSDGGHFENLAMYEMVARGCKDILVLDGGCDPDSKFEDLGNAIRKINIDMGVEIEFLPDHMERLKNKSRRYALAKIKYPDRNNMSVEEGRLIYIKPSIHGNESPSVLSYASMHPEFPHETTADQWFNEAQSESYRLLGWTSIMEITEGFQGGTIADLFQHIQNRASLTAEKGDRGSKD